MLVFEWSRVDNKHSTTEGDGFISYRVYFHCILMILPFHIEYFLIIVQNKVSYFFRRLVMVAMKSVIAYDILYNI